MLRNKWAKFGIGLAAMLATAVATWSIISELGTEHEPPGMPPNTAAQPPQGRSAEDLAKDA